MATVETGKSSGGPFAIGYWKAGARGIETHVRYGLGIVEYHWGDLSVSHADYMRAMNLVGEYPGFGADPIDGFAHLAADLSGPARGLLDCTRSDFEAMLRSVDDLPRKWLP
ncbi:hypothetical protein EFK50_18580 [Nocardioides marmoriginsengisoli]|uniref:Uncharacterized protein n=2 Tax=Nocardioides marmoriginsengisoli TaxID=661483 RepID=A0A3N0CDI5_9ACTN|nr:hypothetical protein EFK50_18580 [Nocardioides marmoriginsengisoli]